MTVTNIGGSPTTGSVDDHRQRSRRTGPDIRSGAGWTCGIAAQGGAICNRSDALAPGGELSADYDDGGIAANAPPTVTNTATVSGGGDGNASNNTASDPATILAGPDLAITKSHTGNFTQGQPGTYTLTVEQCGRLADQRLRYRH